MDVATYIIITLVGVLLCLVALSSVRHLNAYTIYGMYVFAWTYPQRLAARWVYSTDKKNWSS